MSHSNAQTFDRNRRCTPSKAWLFWTTTATAYWLNTTTTIFFLRSKSKKRLKRICSIAPTEPMPKSSCWTVLLVCTGAMWTCFFTLWVVRTRMKYVVRRLSIHDNLYPHALFMFQLLLMSVLQCMYDSISQILRKNVEKRVVLDNLDVVMLALDEICDNG